MIKKLNKQNFIISKILIITCILLILSCKKPSHVVIECGGGAQFACPSHSFCNLSQEDCGGIDHKGVCKKIPHDCSIEDKPVCGCNHKTYTNKCIANASKVSIAHQGKCIENK